MPMIGPANSMNRSTSFELEREHRPDTAPTATGCRCLGPRWRDRDRCVPSPASAARQHHHERHRNPDEAKHRCETRARPHLRAAAEVGQAVKIATWTFACRLDRPIVANSRDIASRVTFAESGCRGDERVGAENPDPEPEEAAVGHGREGRQSARAARPSCLSMMSDSMASMSPLVSSGRRCTSWPISWAASAVLPALRASMA